jgi:peptidoglycan hydrolase CwlO-like protein
MNVSTSQIILAIAASILSGFGTALYGSLREKKREIFRSQEKAQTDLKLELKDLEIKLYQLEKDLDKWKDKYYEAIQELIAVKAELEDTLIKLTHIQIHLNEG